MLPVVDHKPKYVGRFGKEFDAEAGRDAVRTAALSGLAAAKQNLDSLNKITRVVRLGVFIATSGDFFDQPRVTDAVSDLFRDIFGSEKMSVRLVIGVASPPLGQSSRKPSSKSKTAREPDSSTGVDSLGWQLFSGDQGPASHDSLAESR
jgi:hypothetical protein